MSVNAGGRETRQGPGVLSKPLSHGKVHADAHEGCVNKGIPPNLARVLDKMLNFSAPVNACRVQLLFWPQTGDPYGQYFAGA